ncbi:hypothetical protein GBA52_028789 [Prunus armeniaca]|nr:hypothetical protein GBA52_028789 [Prunus armeniaca]
MKFTCTLLRSVRFEIPNRRSKAVCHQHVSKKIIRHGILFIQLVYCLYTTSVRAFCSHRLTQPLSFTFLARGHDKTVCQQKRPQQAIHRMGVHGLWELLAPVGRRVSVETLAGRRLAHRCEHMDGAVYEGNAGREGRDGSQRACTRFFRRICKLLYLRTKPVFVFDGGTPALKRRTVIARRRQRENAQSKLRKTAEKLLLNHLKAMKLKVLAEDIKNQRQNQKNDAKGKQSLPDQTGRWEMII